MDLWIVLMIVFGIISSIAKNAQKANSQAKRPQAQEGQARPRTLPRPVHLGPADARPAEKTLFAQELEALDSRRAAYARQPAHEGLNAQDEAHALFCMEHYDSPEGMGFQPEAVRPAPSTPSEKPSQHPGFTLSLDAPALVQAVVFSEILKRRSVRR